MMMEWSSKVLGLLTKENAVHLLLVSAFAALGARSVVQQNEIDALEAEKEALRSSNRAMQKAMWNWRQALSNLYESDPSSSPISLSKLRAIYGEKDPQQAAEVAMSYSIPPLPYMQPEQQGAAGESGAPNPTSTNFAI